MLYDTQASRSKLAGCRARGCGVLCFASVSSQTIPARSIAVADIPGSLKCSILSRGAGRDSARVDRSKFMETEEV